MSRESRKTRPPTLDSTFRPTPSCRLANKPRSTTEEKTYAPGYGEFYTAGGDDVEALAVPTDALSSPQPAELETVSSGALAVFDAARSGDWNAASNRIEEITAAWKTYRAGEVPKMIERRMSEDLAALTEAVDARDATQARQAAINAAQLSLDLQLQHQVTLTDFSAYSHRLLINRRHHGDG